jgi:hypothetical protein
VLAYSEFGGKGNSLKMPIHVDLQLIRQKGQWGIFEYTAQGNQRSQGWILMQNVKPDSTPGSTGSSQSSSISTSTTLNQQSAQGFPADSTAEGQVATFGLQGLDGKWVGSAKSSTPTRCGNILAIEMLIRNGSVRGKVTLTGTAREAVEFLGNFGKDGSIEIRDKDLVIEGIFFAEEERGQGLVDMTTLGCKGTFQVTKTYWP